MIFVTDLLLFAGDQLLSGLLYDAQIGFYSGVSGEALGGFFVCNCGRNDYVFAGSPVHWRGQTVLGGQLQGIDYAQNFVEVSARRCWVGEHQFDGFVGTNYKY